MKVNKAYYPQLNNYNHLFEVYYGGAGSGKSYFVTQKIILKCLRSKRKVLVLRKAKVTLRNSVIALFLSILDSENIPYTYKSSYKSIELGNSVILFEGIDDPERIKSIVDVTDIWLEEATEFYPADFLQLVLRLRTISNSLQYFLTFNPVSKVNWVYRFFFDKSSTEYYLHNKSYLILRTTYKDNIGNLPPEYVNELEQLKFTHPLYYSIYALGEFGVLSKLIFPINSYLIQPYKPINPIDIYGLDPGYTDPTALLHSQVDSDILYVKEEFCQSEIITTQLAQYIKSRGWSTKPIICDSAAALTIAELKKQGIYNVKPATKLPGSVLEGINQIKSYKLIINPSCTNFINDIRNYSWQKDKKSGLYISVPERGEGDLHQNLIDALRYSLQSLGSQVKTLNVKLPKGI